MGQILAIRIGFPRNQVESICLYLIFTQGLLINTANAGWYRPIMSDMVDKICTVMMPLQMKMKMKLLWYGQLSLCLCACACVLLPLFSCQWYIKLSNVYYIRILFELLGSSKLMQSPLIQEQVLLPVHNLASKKGWVGI